MTRRLKIEGIYDSKTMLLLKQASIRHFGFDFRPKSFNFIQAYRLLEMIEEHFALTDRYDLHFCGEKEFVVEKIIQDLDSALIKKAGRGFGDHAHLQFSDQQNFAYYDQFNLPYILYYYEQFPWDQLHRAKNIKGLVLPYPLLLEMHEQNQFAAFATKLHKEMTPYLSPGGMELHLSLDWGANVFPSLFEYLDVNFCALSVNGKLESSYRKVDPDKVKNELKICQELVAKESQPRQLL